MVDQALRQAHEQAFVAVSAAAAAQRQAAGEARVLLRALSELPPMRRMDPEASRALLRSAAENNPQYANILLLSPSGDVVASSQAHGPVDMAGSRHTHDALEEKGFTAGECILPTPGGEALFPYAQAVPGENGSAAGVLVAELRLTQEQALPGTPPLPKDFGLALLDRSGTRMLRVPPNRESRPTGGRVNPRLWETLRSAPGPETQEIRYDSGERWIFSSQRLSLDNESTPYMHVVAGISRDVVLRALHKELNADLGLMVLATVVAATAALMIGEAAIVRRIHILIRRAGNIAAGNYTDPAPAWVSPRELAGLADAFNSMSRSLDSRDEKRRRLIRALRASRKRFKDVADSVSDWIWETDVAGRFTFVSGRVMDVLGYLPEEMHGREMFDFLIPGEKERARAILEEYAGHQFPFNDLELWHEAKDVRRVCLRMNGLPMLNGFGALLGYRGVCVDVTTQKANEERIIRSLGEKEVLLKEIHHRVKNNLQIISSLMSLQSQEYPDVPQVEEAFAHMRGRVRSIALIHQKLYDTGDFAAVEMAGYVESLANNIKESNEMPGRDITFRFELAPLHLALDQALPLGLMVNEMVTNAFKHAFNGLTYGVIALRLGREDGEVFLEVSDTGKGLPPDVKSGERHGLGFQLIAALADQLGGTVHFPERGGGAAILLTFGNGPIP